LSGAIVAPSCCTLKQSPAILPTSPKKGRTSTWSRIAAMLAESDVPARVGVYIMYRLIKNYLQRYKKLFLVVVAFQLIGTIASLYLPTLNADIIDNGVIRGDFSYIVRVGGWMLGVSLVQILCSTCALYCGAKSATGFGRDVRAALFYRIGGFSAREIARLGTPSLITRNTNDVKQVQMLLLTGCTTMVVAPIMCTGGIIMALRLNPGLSWLMLVAASALFVSVGLIIIRTVPKFRSMQHCIDSINRVLREQIVGIRVIRAFVRERYEATRFAAVNENLTQTTLGVGRLMVMMFPVVMLIFNVSCVGVLWFGGHRINNDEMQIGSLIAFLAYLTQILASIMMTTFMAIMIPRAAVCAKRITEVFDTDSSVVPPPAPIRPASRRGKVEFRAAGFAYPGADQAVLKNITFTAHPGQITAIVGSNGSGKSTLVRLVPRLYDVSAGAVLIDSIDIRDLDLGMLRSRMGLVPATPYLFSGTVASNLRYGNPHASDKQLWDALEVAQGRDFVEAMPRGLGSPIAQGGTNLSGGQRQRLCIARALVTDPLICLFDDAFSALDLSTEARLRAALRSRARGATVIIVAQRVSTIVDADQIVVLENGQVTGIGRHEQLLDDCQTYLEIVSSQMGVERVA
jgi:ATP-binding cassette, subfamily B, multidrug efflux pump